MWIFYYGTTFSGQFWWDQKLNKNWCHSRLPVFEYFTASCLFAYWHCFKDFTTSCLLPIFINKKWQLYVYFFFHCTKSCLQLASCAFWLDMKWTWELLSTAESCWMLLSTVDGCWALLRAAKSFLKLLSTAECCWALLSILDSCWAFWCSQKNIMHIFNFW